MRKKLFRTLFTVVGAIAILLGTQTAAQAETRGNYGADNSWVEQDTATGYCLAEVNTVYSGGSLYAYGAFGDEQAGWSCTGWLERSTNSGVTWSEVSGDHIVYSKPGIYDHAQTGNYYDGLGYLARACFKLSFSGAATHCSYAL
jgi:hypothetical protein